MRLLENQIRLSASDLANHLGCRHLTWRNHRVAVGELEAAKRADPRLEALIERGEQHEAAYLEHLEALGRTVVRLPKRFDDVSRGIAETGKAVELGAAVIAQATLRVLSS